MLWLRARPSGRARAEARRREALDPWSFQRGREPSRPNGADPWSVQDRKPPWEL
ncbi:MAG: hypothetical protein K2L38_08405 [Dysosmobacter sp.]|nr:hypothetical protein [Dysosmobacter sp.]